MVESKVRRGLLCIGILVVLQLECTIAVEYFTSKCGQTIDISTGHSVRLDSQSALTYGANLDCTVTIQTSLWEQVLITFDRAVGIEGSPSNCNSDYLEIYDGSIFATKLATICGYSKPSAVASTLNWITLNFKTDVAVSGTGFYIISTSFSRGFCGSDEFKCDNGRCIDYSLKNNLYDNCGDLSDETNIDDLVNNPLVIVGVVVGCLVGVVLLCICCGCLCYHLCCKSKPSTTSTTVIVPQGGQQHPGAYGQQPGAPPPAYNQPPMAMQQSPGQFGQQQAPYNVKT